jgi:ABC-type Fe3+ transport system permease subunit
MAEMTGKPSFWSRAFDLKSMPGFTTMAIICFFLLYVPLVPLVVYSFNSGSSIALWEGFSWRWYEAAWANTRVQEATILSLIVAALGLADCHHRRHDGGTRHDAHAALSGHDGNLCR